MARTAGSFGERTEAALREAAVALMARHGYEAVSMRRLAAEIGLQAAALYKYFPTKEDLLFTLMREHMEALIAAWQAADPGGDHQTRRRTTSSSTSSGAMPPMCPTWSCAACRRRG